MSAIKNGVYTVTLKGKEYGLLFSLNALDEVQGKFGGYDKLGEIFNDKNPDLFKNTRWLLTLLINEWQLSEDESAQLIEETLRKCRTLFMRRLHWQQKATGKRKRRTGTAAATEITRETGRACRKVRYCTPFVYSNGAAGVQGA